jgi:hypothetical protein
METATFANRKLRLATVANLNKSVSKMSSMAFFVTSWQLAFSYSLDTGEQRLIGCHL